MKLSELKPCALCGGPLLRPPCGTWYVLRVTQAMVNPAAARQVLGLTTMLWGALGLAEAFAPEPEEAVMVFGDKDRHLMTELHVCFDCWVGKLSVLGMAVEKAGEAKSQGGEKAANA
jgi:hypothetical protein